MARPSHEGPRSARGGESEAELWAEEPVTLDPAAAAALAETRASHALFVTEASGVRLDGVASPDAGAGGAGGAATVRVVAFGASVKGCCKLLVQTFCSDWFSQDLEIRVRRLATLDCVFDGDGLLRDLLQVLAIALAAKHREAPTVRPVVRPLIVSIAAVQPDASQVI